MYKWKLIAINLLVFFVLSNFIYWSLPTLSALYRLTTVSVPTPADDPRGRLPNYEKVTWARQHFLEFNQLKCKHPVKAAG